MGIIGFLAGLLTLLTYVPQAAHTIRTGKTRDLSLATLFMLSLGALLWVIYGLNNRLPAVWLTNSVVFLLSLAILSVKLRDEA